MRTISELLESIDNKLGKIDNKIDNLDKRIKNLEDIMINNTEECKKMGNHIDFVENVYDTVKHPLGYICNNVKYYIGDKKDNFSLDNK